MLCLCLDPPLFFVRLIVCPPSCFLLFKEVFLSSCPNLLIGSVVGGRVSAGTCMYVHTMDIR